MNSRTAEERQEWLDSAFKRAMKSLSDCLYVTDIDRMSNQIRFFYMGQRCTLLLDSWDATEVWTAGLYGRPCKSFNGMKRSAQRKAEKKAQRKAQEELARHHRETQNRQDREAMTALTGKRYPIGDEPEDTALNFAMWHDNGYTVEASHLTLAQAKAIRMILKAN
jgi:hypothetical protein